MNTKAVASTVLAAGLLFSAAGRARDGAYEINQACVDSGCFAGDAPGLPIQITQPGVYRMTSDLFVPTVSARGIVATVEGVHLDMDGHVVRGPNVCPDPVTPENCPYGAAIGIDLKADSQLENGGVLGIGGVGAKVGARCQVTNVHARGNGFSGLEMAEGSVGFNVRAYSNAYHGVQIGKGSRCVQCVAQNNARTGFYVAGGVIERSSSIGNASYGIALESGGQVLDSVVSGNEVGMYIAQGGALVRDSTFSDNANFGIQVFQATGQEKSSLRGNTLTGNNGGSGNLQIGGDNWVQLGPNLCGTTVCP